jgi:hypothetical protein
VAQIPAFVTRKESHPVGFEVVEHVSRLLNPCGKAVVERQCGQEAESRRVPVPKGCRLLIHLPSQCCCLLGSAAKADARRAEREQGDINIVAVEEGNVEIFRPGRKTQPWCDFTRFFPCYSPVSSGSLQGLPLDLSHWHMS